MPENILKKYSVLYVRTNENIVTNIDTWLIDSFKSLSFISNPNDVITAIDRDNIRIVLIDLDFGYESINIARYLKEKRIYTIAINSYSENHILVEAINSGFFDKFIIKPFKKSSLKELLNDLLLILEQEEALKISQERLTLALEGTKDGLWDWDIESNQIFFSARLFEIIGYKPSELPTSFEIFRKICHKDDFFKALKIIKQEIKKERENYSIEHRILKSNGEIIWILNRGKIVFQNNRVVRMVGYITDITEQKNMLNSYILSKFANDNSPEEILWIRRNGTFKYVNDTSCKYLGYTQKELLNKNIYDIDPQERHHPDNFEATWQYLKKKRFVNFTSYHTRKDGSKFPVDMYASLFEFEDREYIFAFGRDITKRIKIQNELKESEAKFRDMFECHSAVMILIDPHSNTIIDANNSALKYYGYSKEELTNLSLFEITTLDKEYVKRNIKTISTKKDFILLSKHKLKNGDIRDVEIHSTPIKINDTSLLFSIVHDITDRIKMQDSIRKQSDFLQLLIDTLPIPLFFKDEKLIYRLYNKAFMEFLGVKSIRGKRSEDVFDIQTAGICDRIDNEILSNNDMNTKKYEYKVLHQDGTFHDIILYKSLLFTNDNIKGVIGAILDINDLKRVETALFEKTKQLKELNKHLEERVSIEVEKQREQEQMLVQQSKMAQMGEMIGNIAHQWKQPLNAISILVQDLEDCFEYKELDEEKMSRFIFKVTNQIQFMSKTVTDFKNFFKPSKSKNRFSILKACKDVLTIIEAQINKNNIDIIFEKDENLDDYINGYENELKQVILNLLTNSKDAINSSEVQNPIILIKIFKILDEIVIEITDNGGGIDSKVMSNLFKAYVSTKGDKGTGIGLYMSKIIIEKSMGGKLLAESFENRARFSIYLPIQGVDVGKTYLFE